MQAEINVVWVNWLREGVSSRHKLEQGMVRRPPGSQEAPSQQEASCGFDFCTPSQQEASCEIHVCPRSSHGFASPAGIIFYSMRGARCFRQNFAMTIRGVRAGLFAPPLALAIRARTLRSPRRDRSMWKTACWRKTRPALGRDASWVSPAKGKPPLNMYVSKATYCKQKRLQ